MGYGSNGIVIRNKISHLNVKCIVIANEYIIYKKNNNKHEKYDYKVKSFRPELFDTGLFGYVGFNTRAWYPVSVRKILSRIPLIEI